VHPEVADVNFLITAGPTREFLDPIRYISNRSSGKMGYALARAAARYGRVTLVSGPVSLKVPVDVEFVLVTTAAEMAKAVLVRYGKADIVIMAAAVCDFRPKTPVARKLKKQAFTGKLALAPTIDILAELGRRKRRQVLVGFAAETNDLEGNAADKLRRKRLDLIVANDVRAFDSDTNRVVIIGHDTRVKLPEMSKARVAAEIVKRAIAIRV
jgi:phosphopantothenoylcysteine decarboxylase / phosphopantothenate---cysteine ligase